MIHELSLERANLHGHFSRDLPPVVTIDPGDSVRFATPNAGWELDDRTSFEPRTSPEDDGHALAGPIEVRGARTGQTLTVQIDEVVPGPWGVTLTEPPHSIDWELAGDTGRASTGHAVTLRPFLGVLGMPPVERGVHSTIPPRPQGGNIDCKELVAGSTLYLPIPVDGALFSAGDGHAAQGDGEVSGTAIECPSRAQVTLGLQDDLPLEWPLRAHRRRVADLRLRRAPRPRREDRRRRDGGADGTRARAWRERRARPREHRRRPARDAGRERAGRRPRRAARRRLALSERLRLWLERDRRGAGYHLRDAATGERVSWEDERIRVVPVAGVSFRAEAVADGSFDPGARLALVPEPENEHDANAVGVWNQERTLQAGYVPREVAAELAGDEQAVSLWRAGEGLRVLLVPPTAWVGRPRR